MERARRYRCLTTDADMADLFLVPAFSSRIHNRPTEKSAESREMARELRGSLRAIFTRLRRVHVQRCSMHRRAAVAAIATSKDPGASNPAVSVFDPPRRHGQNCSALEARGGADHILINPRNGAEFESHPLHELDYLDPRWGNITLLDLMEPGEWPWYGNYKPNSRYHSVPHPSMVHLEPGSVGLPWRSTHERQMLIVGAFGIAHGPKEVVALRTALQRACDALPDHVCHFHRLDKPASPPSNAGSIAGSRHVRALRRGNSSAVGMLSEPAWHSIARMYAINSPC
jgi:hypothetical protein